MSGQGGAVWSVREWGRGRGGWGAEGERSAEWEMLVGIQLGLTEWLFTLLPSLINQAAAELGCSCIKVGETLERDLEG